MLRPNGYHAFLIGVLFFVLGCGYAPLGLEKNRPDVADARIERDIVLYGENRFLIGEYTDSGYFREDCRLTSAIEGWIEETESGGDCSSCTEVYALTLLETEVEYFTNRIDQQETACDFGLAGGFGLGLAPVELFPVDYSAGFFEWLNDHELDEGDGTAAGYVLTNWSPFGASDWTPRLGLFEAANPIGTGYEREYFVQAYFYYETNHLQTSSGRQFGSVRWQMDLRFDDE